MKTWILAASLPLAACAQSPDNQAAFNEAASSEAVSSPNESATAEATQAGIVANEGNAAAPPPSPAPKPAPELYTARGQEPGWALTIANGRIDYQGNYGEKRIDAATPEPKPIPNGRRYVTERLVVEIVYERCNDAMSGFGFEHKVKVTADGETYQGCGGPRRTDWDM